MQLYREYTGIARESALISSACTGTVASKGEIPLITVHGIAPSLLLYARKLPVVHYQNARDFIPSGAVGGPARPLLSVLACVQLR